MKSRRLIVTLVGLGLLMGVAGCAAPPPTTANTSPSQSVAPLPSTDPGTVSAADQALEAKHALFDETNLRTSRGTSPTSSAFLAGLRSAGFAADFLEATTDVTSVGLTAPSIQFAALVDSTCLIGQYGPADTGYRSVVAAPISTGRCLIGTPSGP